MAEFVVRLEDDWQAPDSYKRGDPIKARRNGFHKRYKSDVCFVVQFPFLGVKRAKTYIRRYSVAGDKKLHRLYHFPDLKPKKKKFIRKLFFNRWIRSK